MTGRYAWLEFVYTPWFEASANGLLDDEGMRAIEAGLVAHPRAGDVVAGTGGVRKLRVALPYRGKRGGGRVLYLYIEPHRTVYFLLAYGKNRQLDLSATQRSALRHLAQLLRDAP